MTLYTSKVIAQWLCLTERRVRQLRDEGVIVDQDRGCMSCNPPWPGTSSIWAEREKKV